ncbi:MAG: hypothetical protein WCP46_00200 [Alphaproteobacteria bacterium]
MIDESLKTANVSALFLKPILNISPYLCTQNRYVNTYLFNAEEDITYENSLQVLFRPQNMNWFNAFIMTEEERGSIILDEFDYPTGEIILVYRLPAEFDEDYKIILEGKYSKVSSKFKNLFMKSIKDNGKELLSLQWLVFNKHKYLKTFWEKEFNTIFTPEQECWGLYNVERECFRLNNKFEESLN